MFGIKIEFPNDQEVVIEYPEDKINDIKSLRRHYKIENTSIVINGGVTKINCPEYCHRVLIFFDIMIGVWKRKYHKIDFLFNDVPTKNIKKLIRQNIKLDKQLYSQEKKLLKTVLESLVKEEFVKVEQDIVYGYELIVELLACGGIR